MAIKTVSSPVGSVTNLIRNRNMMKTQEAKKDGYPSNIEKTDFNTLKKLIEFSLDYDIKKPTEETLVRHDEEIEADEQAQMYNTMQNKHRSSVFRNRNNSVSS